jgi:sugar phosphate isomerase/epimerase
MNVTRRDVLGAVPAAMAGAWALGGLRVSAHGQGGAGAAAFVPAKLGVQLYTVRDQLKTLDATLAAIKATGFDEVETLRPIMGDLPPLLKKHGLTAPSGHFDAALTLDVGEASKRGVPAGYTFDTAVEQAKAVDMKYFVIPYLAREDRQSIDDYKRHADKMNEAGRRCRAAGLQLCYHHHSFEFVKYGEQTGWDVLVSSLDKDLVGFETDVFWLAAAGLDPAATIRQLGSRVKLVHLKDRAAGAPELDESKVGKPAFKEVGSGSLDFPGILRACKDVGVAHYFVEQDQVPADPLASLKQSVTYLRSLKA